MASDSDFVLIVISVFFSIDLFVNYTTWKSESKFPAINFRTIREYRNKCWRGVITLLLIAIYEFALK